MLSAVALVTHPPMQGVGRGEVGVRINHLTGAVSEWNEGSVFVLPGLQRDARLPAVDQSWRAAQMSRADAPAPLQSVEGLSLGADLTVRYAIDPPGRSRRSPRACPTTSAPRSLSRRPRA